MADAEKILKDLSSYYGMEVEKLKFSFEKDFWNLSEQRPLLFRFAGFPLPEQEDLKYMRSEYNMPVTQLTGKNEVQGLRNFVSQFSTLDNPEHEVVQDQWVEYILTHIWNMENSATQMLKELNSHISDKVFFVGNRLGPVDILIYYLMYNTVLNLSYQEKEKYIHFSRWFNNVQQCKETRLGRSVIPFSRTPLYI